MIPADDPMLGDRVFILRLLLQGVFDAVEGSEASMDSRVGGPTWSVLTIGEHAYRVEIADDCRG